jgi:tight adherence protein B
MLVIAVVIGAGVIFLLPMLRPAGSQGAMQQSVRNLVQTQRQGGFSNHTTDRRGPRSSIIDSAVADEKVRRVSSSGLTLEKRLRYAQMKLPPLVFYLSEIAISAVLFWFATFLFDSPFIFFVALMSGPLVMNWVVNAKIYSRFSRFDRDYPSFLLSLIGLLKTGMNTLNALQAASEGLDPDSLARQEIELMLERLKLGVPEDQSIGSFGEDIYHEEIELFVQSLLLSRRVGGNLSDTLDRLARQVRKRQYFRSSANAAIGQQRLSILVIIVILVALGGYLASTSPDLVVGLWNDPTGKQVTEACIVLMMFGIWWIRQITKIRA